MLLVEALVALALGAGVGAGFLFAVGDLKTPAQVDELQAKLSDSRRTLTERKEAAHRAELARIEAAEKARVEAELAAKREAAAREEARLAEEAKASAQAAVARLPAFGALSIKSTGSLSVEAGPLSDRGRDVSLAFASAPEKFKVKSGQFTVHMTPRVQGSRLLLDVSVTPMAIIVADGERKGVTSAQGLVVGRNAFKLDFQSPAAGELNLVLQFRK